MEVPEDDIVWKHSEWLPIRMTQNTLTIFDGDSSHYKLTLMELAVCIFLTEINFHDWREVLLPGKNMLCRGIEIKGSENMPLCLTDKFFERLVFHMPAEARQRMQTLFQTYGTYL